MRPRERRETGQIDLLRARLDQIIDLDHELPRLARTISWPFLETQFGAVYSDAPGQPPLPTRLMAGLAILKHTFDVSDEQLCARWVENPYWQYFCGEEFFCHRAPFDRSSLTRWRQRMGAERLTSLLQESLAVAVKTEAMQLQEVRKPSPSQPTPSLSIARACGWCAYPRGTTSNCARPTRGSARSRSSSTSATRMPGSSSVPEPSCGD